MKAPCDIEIFRQNRFIWVHCLDLSDRFELSLASFPILKLKCLYGHVCFMTDLSERRIHSFFFIRTSNFDAEAERSYIFW